MTAPKASPTADPESYFTTFANGSSRKRHAVKTATSGYTLCGRAIWTGSTVSPPGFKPQCARCLASITRRAQ